jgi:hypothetical protein
MLRIEDVPLGARLEAVRRETVRSLRDGGGGFLVLDEAVELTRLALFAGLDRRERLRLARELSERSHDG